MEFDKIASLRAELREAVRSHASSVLYFATGIAGAPFYRTASDVHKGGPPLGEGRTVGGLTTALTCLESILDSEPDNAEALTLLDAFAALVLENPGEWMSEGAAKTYCRVRALAPLLRLHKSLTDDQRSAASSLLVEAWSQVEPRPQRDGIFEVGAGEVGDSENQYPPNAYLSYWALAALKALGSTPDELEPRVPVVELWLERCLATQIALHAAGAARADSQQLAWAVCGLSIADDLPFAERPSPTLDLVGEGLRCFFVQQSKGTWDKGDALFHYPSAGNAHCYVNETLGELLHLSLTAGENGATLRSELEQYQTNLESAFRHAISVRRTLPPDGTPRFGWCSGHHPHRTTPESWATAGTYRFMQGLRQLFGIWSREEVCTALGARPAQHDLQTLKERGDTWNAGHGPVGLHLASSFVHPNRAASFQETADPDKVVLGEDRARSAILFGPPGTGKTTFVEAVAGALGWRFLEITSASFLDRGVDQVSARADQIFDMLMELDHVVILFDEIDELIRRRGNDSDPLERFFTTTMLPRLAKLWTGRKVLFFVNTNGIADVDSAIQRSQRFDDAILVLPPSFEAKDAIVNGMVEGAVDFKKAETVKVLDEGPGLVAEDVRAFGWFGLLRYDQLARLASALSRAPSLEQDEVATVLQELGREVASLDWDIAGAVSKSSAELLTEISAKYRQVRQYQRRDSVRLRVVTGSGLDGLEDLSDRGDGTWTVLSGEDDLTNWANGNALQIDSSGAVLREP